MSMRYKGGVISATPPTVTISSATGLWTMQDQMRYQAAGTWPPSVVPDPYFEYVTMLLHGDGTNGAQNNTFLDSSTNAFTITRNGSTTQGTFSPFSRANGEWSNYFDGSGDSLSWSGTTLSADFTVECWVYKTAVDASGHTNVFSSAGVNNQLAIDLTTAGSISLIIGGVTIISPSGTAVTANAWHHLAWVREGSTCRAYVNGVQQGTGTSSSSLNLALIGQFQTGGYEMNGYISNVRITNACLYPSGTTFTPSTTPFTTTVSSGTVQLLTCQSNRFIDNSTNAFAITVNGNTSVQVFNPFNPTTAYSTTANGGSGYFDGSGDYLTVASNAAFNFGTGDFTIECWAFLTDSSADDGVISIGDASAQCAISYGSAAGGNVQFRGPSGSNLIQKQSVALNSWHHIAIVRASGVAYLFVDGVSAGSVAFTNNLSQDKVNIGTWSTSGTLYEFTGYISNLRIVKGTAVYTSNFTPSTTPLTAITNTSLLLNFTNAGIFDNAAMNDLETVGNAQISTAQSKFGGGSMYFDGTGDYLAAPARTNFAFPGDFTVEFWMYLTAVSGEGTTFYVTTSGGINLFMNIGSNWGIARSAVGVDNYFGTTPTQNVWNHIAVARSGSTIKAFVNGSQVFSGTNTSSYVDGPMQLGGSGFGTITGYLDDLRITKGYARYTANFTPPTAAFPNL